MEKISSTSLMFNDDLSCDLSVNLKKFPMKATVNTDGKNVFL